ncbi:hypothetical protein PspLS_10486 [Pyricularia sp. CBS 133598]|nr:hypothetical protein PspLS_10486 [Pyricularia sp. CBS 133598]
MPFLRTSHVHPSATDYTVRTGNFDYVDTLIGPKSTQTFYQSYWFMYFIHGSNGRDYFIVGHTVAITATTPAKPDFRVCILDLTDGSWYGETFLAGQHFFSVDAIHCETDRFLIRSTKDGDHLSPIRTRSTVDGAEFDFVTEPRGPTLFAGGQGVFKWGTGWTYQISFPEMWVTGTFKHNGEEVTVVPEKSMAWLDRQYGVGIGRAGWDLAMLIFENGIKASIWMSKGWDGYKPQYQATVVFPDSHHEIYPVDENVELSQPYVSEATGVTYHAHAVIRIPGLDASIELQQPWPKGEMSVKGAHNPITTLFEGYVNASAQIRGEAVKEIADCAFVTTLGTGDADFSLGYQAIGIFEGASRCYLCEARERNEEESFEGQHVD